MSDPHWTVHIHHHLSNLIEIVVLLGGTVGLRYRVQVGRTATRRFRRWADIHAQYTANAAAQATVQGSDIALAVMLMRLAGQTPVPLAGNGRARVEFSRAALLRVATDLLVSGLHAQFMKRSWNTLLDEQVRALEMFAAHDGSRGKSATRTHCAVKPPPAKLKVSPPCSEWAYAYEASVILPSAFLFVNNRLQDVIAMTLPPREGFINVDRARALLPQRRDGVCSFLYSRPYEIDLRPHLFTGIPCRIDIARTDLLEIINSIGNISIITSVPRMARILGAGIYQYSVSTALARQLSGGSKSLSLWTALDTRGFPGYPLARHTLFLAVESSHRYSAVALAYEISRVLDQCVYRHGLEKKPNVLAVAHAINGSGAWAFLLFDECGRFAYDSELSSDPMSGGFINFHGYDVIARPPVHLRTLDASTFDDLVTIRRQAVLAQS
ncbi:hypothetical protein PENSPDRAFT_667019 [Peniophora sp. CONT]|nr:hypothetical protein PENSPDRAFT_667019 [Peniophora sp. CONT]